MTDKLKWLKYSNIIIRLGLNPFSWAWIHFFRKENGEVWGYSSELIFKAGWLFAVVSLHIDDGQY